MPEICRFYGIIIAMFGDDHNPPHFHVRYGSFKASITIDRGIVTGQLPRNVLNKVFSWLDAHYDELMDNWKRLQEGGVPHSIEPLKYNTLNTNKSPFNLSINWKSQNQSNIQNYNNTDGRGSELSTPMENSSRKRSSKTR